MASVSFGFTSATGFSGDGGGDDVHAAAQRVTATSSGTLTELAVNLANATGSIRIALFSDSSGTPATELALSSDATAVNGFNVLSISGGPAITNGTSYHVVVQVSSSTTEIMVKAPATNGAMHGDMVGYSSGMPSTWSNSWTYDGDFCAYATVDDGTSSGVTSTVAATAGAPTSSASATVAVPSAAVSASAGAPTASATCKVGQAITSTVAATIGAPTASATGTVGAQVSCSVSASTGAPTASASLSVGSAISCAVAALAGAPIANATASTSVACTVSATAGAPTSAATCETTGISFPVHTHSSGRYLVDSSGTPWRMKGRAIWGILRLTRTDYLTVLNDCVEKGINTIEVGLIWTHSMSDWAPACNGGTLLPFTHCLNGSAYTGNRSWSGTGAPDFNTSNSAYWDFVEQFLEDCEDRGLVVEGFPCYLGYSGASSGEGWMREMNQNGATKIGQYGTYAAGRLKTHNNLIVLWNGDYVPAAGSETTIRDALIDSFNAVSGLPAWPCSSENQTTDSWSLQDSKLASLPRIVNGVYSYNGQISSTARSAYADALSYGTAQVYMEGPYATGPNTPPASAPVMRYQPTALLNGCRGGGNYGDQSLWPFNDGWDSELDGEALGLPYFHAFVDSLQWWRLIPQQLESVGRLLTSPVDGGTPGNSDYVSAAIYDDSATLVIYNPPARSSSITFDSSKLSGTYSLRRVDPYSGASTTIGTGYTNTGTRTITHPGNNSAGYSDWWFVAEAEAAVPTCTVAATAGAPTSSAACSVGQSITSTVAASTGAPTASASASVGEAITSTVAATSGAPTASATASVGEAVTVSVATMAGAPTASATASVTTAQSTVSATAGAPVASAIASVGEPIAATVSASAGAPTSAGSVSIGAVVVVTMAATAGAPVASAGCTVTLPACSVSAGAGAPTASAVVAVGEPLAATVGAVAGAPTASATATVGELIYCSIAATCGAPTASASANVALPSCAVAVSAGAPTASVTSVIGEPVGCDVVATAGAPVCHSTARVGLATVALRMHVHAMVRHSIPLKVRAT